MDSKKDNDVSAEEGQNSPTQQGHFKWEENIFKSYPRDLYIFRKTEKLCGAIHFITNFLSDKEPLRWTLRDRSVNLLSISMSFMNNAESSSSSLISVRLIEIKSLLQTAFFSGLISEMNLNILKDELDRLLAFIESKRQTLITLSASFLEVPMPQAPQQSIGQPIRHSAENAPSAPVVRQPYVPKKDFSIDRSFSQSTSDRTNKILGLLKDGKELTIKDFSSIKGCSEKTLQRELLRLVAEGRIIKRGERRWSRYSLQ